MPEFYRTIGRARFYWSTAYVIQHCTMCNSKSDVPAFSGWKIIVSLYDSSILYK